MQRFVRRSWCFLLVGCLAACGGGGGGGGGGDTPVDPPTTPPTTPPAGEQPFGLTSRPPTPALNLPIEPQPGSGQVQLVEAATGFTNPVFFTSVPGGGGRHAVVERTGLIRLVAADLTPMGTLLDLRNRLALGGEQGLLGLAFDPAVASNGFFYVHYNSSPGGNGRCATSPVRCSLISRFRLNSDGAGGFLFTQVDTASEQILLEVAQPFENHKGGMIAFGPDNYLYIAFGDGGSQGDPAGNGQNRATLLGKLLRIDVRGGGAYTVPPDNPFVGNASGWRTEIWALGFRNPWRFSFDRQTGDLWLGDVGQDTWEEINRVTRGGNYGWNIREGAHPYSGAAAPPGLIDPVYEYSHGLGVSVTGGYVYRGAAMPALSGLYVYGDFGSGSIWAFNPANGTNQLVANSGASVSSFGEDAAGELLVVDYGGRLLRMTQGGGGTGGPPALLSATGLFTNLAALQAAPGLIEYDINTPFWSDGAIKRRWLALPAGGQIVFSPDGAWQLPVGSAVIKHFAIALDQRDPARLRLLETRVLLHERNGWAGYTYRWNSEQSDAQLITAGASETLNRIDANGAPFSQQYDYPSSAQCRSCHTTAAGFLLGVRTAQLNRVFNYVDSRGTVPDNQLRSFNHINLFTTPIGDPASYAVSTAIDDPAVSSERRARDYLQTNCAHCHQPGGPTPSSLDLRSNVALAAMQAIDVAPTAGNLGITDARIIAPGSKERSVLWQRMNRTDTNRMPPLSSHVVDATAVSVIGEWIDSL